MFAQRERDGKCDCQTPKCLHFSHMDHSMTDRGIDKDE
jgi:hypothetical protein